MGADKGDSSTPAVLSSQVILLLLGLVIGALTGFLSEIAKDEYTALESRHLIVVQRLSEQTQNCDASWPELGLVPKSTDHCKKVSFLVKRKGNGSVSQLDLVALLNNHEPYVFAHDNVQSEPDEFPAQFSIADPQDAERLYSRRIEITDFRESQSVEFVLSIAGQGDIPPHLAHMKVESNDPALTVSTGADLGFLYVTLLLSCAIALVLLLVALVVATARVRKLRNALVSLREHVGEG